MARQVIQLPPITVYDMDGSEPLTSTGWHLGKQRGETHFGVGVEPLS
jgi:hypothetical protein